MYRCKRPAIDQYQSAFTCSHATDDPFILSYGNVLSSSWWQISNGRWEKVWLEHNHLHVTRRSSWWRWQLLPRWTLGAEMLSSSQRRLSNQTQETPEAEEDGWTSWTLFVSSWNWVCSSHWQLSQSHRASLGSVFNVLFSWPCSYGPVWFRHRETQRFGKVHVLPSDPWQHKHVSVCPANTSGCRTTNTAGKLRCIVTTLLTSHLKYLLPRHTDGSEPSGFVATRILKSHAEYPGVRIIHV